MKGNWTAIHGGAEKRHGGGGVPWMLVVALGVALSTVAVNAFICVALCRRRRSHAARSHLFVLNLAGCGLLGALVATAFHLLGLLYRRWEELTRFRSLCIVQQLGMQFASLVNVAALGLVALDRYILFAHGLRYLHIVTRTRTLSMIGTSWFVSALGSLCVLLDNNWTQGANCRDLSLIPSWHLLAVQIPTNGAVLLLVVATHLRMHSEAKRSEKLHQQLRTALGLPEERGRDPSVRATNVVTQVVTCYILAYTPLQILLVLDLLDIGEHRSRRDAFLYCDPVSNLGIMLNPILYSWKNAHLREDLLILWRNIAAFVKKSCTLRICS